LSPSAWRKKTAKNIAGNEKLTATLLSVIEEAGVKNGTEKSIGNLLYSLAAKFPATAIKYRSIVAKYIASKQIKSVPQLDAAFAFMLALGSKDLDVSAFERDCGIGITISPEQIRSTVASLIEEQRAKIVEDRYRTNVGLLLRTANERLKWADGSVVKQEVDSQILALLGPKTEADMNEGKKPKKSAKASEELSVPNGTSPTQVTAPPKKERWDFGARELNAAKNPPHLAEAHLKATGGRVVTRFPPEPNGHLHLGHAKAMWVDFGYAKEMGGECIMRFDDTNPEAEKEEYIDSILDDVQWMGHKWSRVTYSSDYFQQLYDLGVELIKKDKAYVDHQTPTEIASCREAKIESPWRNRPIAESLKLFEDMRKGKYGEGEATLRMKMDMQHPNPCMRDLIAFRVKMSPHPHTGDKWCIYPSYDYTHCIIDSVENITHSLCTLEFEIRRDSYYWLLEALDLYRPHVWEYNRLNLSHNVVSKRKLLRLVRDGHVDGWDDPRLLTLKGLRRRGYTPTAISKFCDMVGVSRSEQNISYTWLEYCIREECDEECVRGMVVLDPLKVTLTDYVKGTDVERVSALNHPKHPERGSHEVSFGPVIYIERSDFRTDDSKDYYGLAPKKEVMLRNACNITCTEVIKDDKGNIVELKASHDTSKTRKPKGVLHWVAEPTPGQVPVSAEIRLYDTLFTVEDPGARDDWLNFVNPKALVVTKGYVDTFVAGAAHVGAKFQFERTGYFVVDKDTTQDRLVFNRIVSLKETYKGAGAPPPPPAS